MSDKKDLSLIPVDDLVKEIEARCVSFVCAYETYKEENRNSSFYYGKGNWYAGVRLSAILHNDVLNNWNGELRTLQRINEEEKFTE